MGVEVNIYWRQYKDTWGWLLLGVPWGGNSKQQMRVYQYCIRPTYLFSWYEIGQGILKNSKETMIKRI